MTRIAYVVGGLPFGGVENWLFDIALKLQASDAYECRIFNVSGMGSSCPNSRPRVSSGLHRGLRRFDRDAQARHGLRLRGELKKYGPHIIHTLHFSGDYFGRIAALGLKVPVITNIRNVKRETKRSGDSATSSCPSPRTPISPIPARSTPLSSATTMSAAAGSSALQRHRHVTARLRLTISGPCSAFVGRSCSASAGTWSRRISRASSWP